MTNVTTLNTTISMISFDFLNNFINPARVEAGEVEVRNNRFMDKVMDELDLSENLCYTKSVKQNLSNKMARPQKIKCVDLDIDQMMMVGMRESKAVRKAVLAQLKALTAENKMMTTALVEVTQTKTLEAAHGIAEEVLARRELLRNTYKTEVTQTLTDSFKNRTSGGGRNIGQVICNHAKLISLIATGSTPCVFKKEHDGMAPRDYAVATNNLELIDALSRAEAKVLALSEAGLSYTEIKSILVKD